MPKALDDDYVANVVRGMADGYFMDWRGRLVLPPGRTSDYAYSKVGDHLQKASRRKKGSEMTDSTLGPKTADALRDKGFDPYLIETIARGQARWFLNPDLTPKRDFADQAWKLFVARGEKFAWRAFGDVSNPSRPEKSDPEKPDEDFAAKHGITPKELVAASEPGNFFVDRDLLQSDLFKDVSAASPAVNPFAGGVNAYGQSGGRVTGGAYSGGSQGRPSAHSFPGQQRPPGRR